LLQIARGRRVPDLDSVLGNARPAALAEQPACRATPSWCRRTRAGCSPRRAHAVEPLAVEDLAAVLDWTVERVAAALDHAEHHPTLASPVALRWNAPGT
jgi:hypothetical protein